MFDFAYTGGHGRKPQSYTLLSTVRGIHRSLVDFPHTGPVICKAFPYRYVITNELISRPCEIAAMCVYNVAKLYGRLGNRIGRKFGIRDVFVMFSMVWGQTIKTKAKIVALLRKLVLGVPRRFDLQSQFSLKDNLHTWSILGWISWFIPT